TTPAALPRISRLRLLNTLHGSLASCTSTIVNGRAGTGKTMLATDFAKRSGRRVAWYKVDASDGDLRVFFQYLIESVRRERPRFGYEMLVKLLAETSAPEDVPLLAESFVYELIESGSDPLLIVVDDLHLVYDAEWVVPFFRRLLPLLPPEAHMLITGRSLPPGPLWRMRSKQTLCVIEEGVMAFTEEEAKRLFKSYGLTQAQALSALAQTRGRASALDRAAALLSAPGKATAAGAKTGKRRRINRASILQIHGYLI
ncbi:MAG TPA: AAA family ATPase, partial [Pyrinomonadaceae bacterium]|nr:AAA family ATPase [Pyrinomonadaceae bacterium]